MLIKRYDFRNTTKWHQLVLFTYVQLKRLGQLGGLSLILVLGHLLEAILDHGVVVQSRNNVLEGHSRTLELNGKVGSGREKRKSSSLVSSSKRCGDKVQQSGDTESHLDHGNTHDGVAGKVGLSGEEGLEPSGHD